MKPIRHISGIGHRHQAAALLRLAQADKLEVIQQQVRGRAGFSSALSLRERLAIVRGKRRAA